MPPDSGTTKSRSLTNREKQLILFLRKLDWGEVKVRVEKGQPVLITEAIRTLKLDEEPVAKLEKKDNKKLT